MPAKKTERNQDKRFGWLSFPDRTKITNKAHDKILEAAPKFFIAHQTKATEGQKVLLWEYSRKVLGKDIPTLEQQTGSCVGNGAWNAIQYLMTMEIARLGEFEKYELTFLPYPYGRGRYHAGIRGRGDGSTGSGQAEALTKDGSISNNFPDLPKPSGEPYNLTWGEKVEYDWSDGAKINNKWITEGKVHLVKSAALVTSYPQVRDALVNGYPVTVASNRGFSSRAVIKNGKKWAKPSGNWAHQMIFIGADDDRQYPGCYCENSWGKDGGVPGEQPDGAPEGGFWVDAEVVESMVRQEDSFAFSQYEGFPEQDLPKWFT